MAGLLQGEIVPIRPVEGVPKGRPHGHGSQTLTDAVQQDLGSNYVLNDVETVDHGKVSIKDSATNNSGVYDDKTAKDDKTITFSNTWENTCDSHTFLVRISRTRDCITIYLQSSFNTYSKLNKLRISLNFEKLVLSILDCTLEYIRITS